MLRHGWTLLFHEGVTLQLHKLQEATARAEQNDPQGFENNANVKLFRALSHLIMEAVPADPGRDEFRQGNTLGTAYRHWRRAKIGRRFRLFFRYDSRSKVIVYAWVNDENTLRSAGSKSAPYAVFEKMLGRGNPPDDWNTLIAAARRDWCESKL
ncbi:type II toxin-antitoxin system YhaV family toxin [Pseudomonas sp. p1(2021b)]|uniref:type II toxin-antitoxin system YhaV family toxin n=1 Tax=Pseudomonas sp. p1(2021b) TaxID=2874628 RepID=UPI001CCEC1FF|nr:type II toxin-antitoxin system YhaV family toxin [Pseudomonas sp. p1(2021b)]UBM23391.1 type II toxin-antitoxin system YhaV family toxin [Pseudomonas sp. p1(2021b)]